MNRAAKTSASSKTSTTEEPNKNQMLAVAKFPQEEGDAPRKQSITEKHAKEIFVMRLTKNSKAKRNPKTARTSQQVLGVFTNTLLPPKPTETPQLLIEEKESAADRSTFDS